MDISMDGSEQRVTIDSEESVHRSQHADGGRAPAFTCSPSGWYSFAGDGRVSDRPGAFLSPPSSMNMNPLIPHSSS